MGMVDATTLIRSRYQELTYFDKAQQTTPRKRLDGLRDETAIKATRAALSAFMNYLLGDICLPCEGDASLFHSQPLSVPN